MLLHQNLTDDYLKYDSGFRVVHRTRHGYGDHFWSHVFMEEKKERNQKESRPWKQEERKSSFPNLFLMIFCEIMEPIINLLSPYWSLWERNHEQLSSHNVSEDKTETIKWNIELKLMSSYFNNKLLENTFDNHFRLYPMSESSDFSEVHRIIHWVTIWFLCCCGFVYRLLWMRN